MQNDGSHVEEEVVDYAVQLWRDKFGNAPFPDFFVSAQNLTPADHVKMQAAAQKWVDSSISKTINCPEDISFDDFKEVYIQAYDTGCKGCTTYRPNEVTGSVLSAGSEEKSASDQEANGDIIYMSEPLDRPSTLDGNTYKLKWPDSEHAIYVTINDIIVNDMRRPFEVFINSKNMEHFAWTVGLTRMISAVFRRGGDVSFVVDELKAVFDPRGGAWVGGKYIPSILAAIGGILEEHMMKIGFIKDTDTSLFHKSSEVTKLENLKISQQKSCTSCGQFDLQMIEGCMTCRSCGYSKCG